MSYVPATLRRVVTQRTGEQCKYCRFPKSEKCRWRSPFWYAEFL